MCINIFLKAFCILSAFTMLAGCSNSTSSSNLYSATIAEGRAAVKNVMAEAGASSVSVALVDGDKVIWSEAFGKADIEKDKNADTTTLYSACSVSKMLATVATMILVDRGQVSLDEPIATYIKNFEMPLDQRYRCITVRMLLNHTSGLTGSDMRGAITVAPFPEYAANIMESLKYLRLKHAPGIVSAYNNDGFTMVQNLVKAVTGQGYPDFVRQNILTPLGMNKSRYQTESLPDGSYAKSYSGETRLTMYSINTYGSGSLFSTPEELSRLAIMLMNKGGYNSRRILSEQSVVAMVQDQRLGTLNPTPNEEYRYGLGWDTIAQPGLAAVGIPAWQKTGDMSGYFGANIVVLPEEKLGVIVFGASNRFDSSLAVKISERILLRALVERGRLAAMPEQLPDVTQPTKSVTAEEKKAFTGYYASGTTAYRLSFGADDSLLVEEYTGADALSPKYRNMKPRGDGLYTADGDPGTSIGLKTQSGFTYFVLRLKKGYGHYRTTSMFGQRLDNKPAISAAWQARLGERWLPVNDDPVFLSFGDRSVQLKTVAGLTGYLMGSTILRDMASLSTYRLDGMFIALPDIMRDLKDAAIETWNNQSWLRQGSYLYRPLSGLPLLAAGATTVAIGKEGFTEWRQLTTSGTVTIGGATNWFLYDAGFKTLASGTTSGTPSFSGSGAKYLALFGTKGATINLSLAVQ